MNLEWYVSSLMMIPLLSVSLLFTFVLSIFAVPVTQTSLTDTQVYDAVVVGTNALVALRPATTGVPSPISTLTDIDIVSCNSGEICIDDVLTDSASHVVWSTVAEFSLLPASIVTALSGIIGALETGTGAGRTTSRLTDGMHSISATSGAARQRSSSSSAISNSTRQGRPFGSVTSSSAGEDRSTGSVSASKNSSSQLTWSGILPLGSAVSDTVSRFSVSSTASVISTAPGSSTTMTSNAVSGSFPTNTGNLGFNSTASLSTTIQGMRSRNQTGSVTATLPRPTGQITFALEVTDSHGSTTDEVAEVAYSSGVPSTNVLFMYADSVTTTEISQPTGVSIQTLTTSTCTTAGAVVTTTSSGSTVTTEVPELCTHGLAFLIFGLPGFHSSSDLPSLCHKTFSFPLGVIWRLLCPSIGPPTFSIISVDPKVLPPGGGPPGENPNDGDPDDNPTHTAGPSETQGSSRTQSSSHSTQSTSSSSATATPSRYVVMPLIDTPQSSFDSLFAPYAQRKDVTQAKNKDGSLGFFALELNDTEASTLNTKTDIIVVQESGVDIEMPDSEETDPGLEGAVNSNPNVIPRDLRKENRDSETGRLWKRIPLQGWAEKVTAWNLAIISLVPGLPLPDYTYEEIYPYYSVDTIEPGQNVRAYLLDTGLNMAAPEFDGRLKPGITRGRTQDDWDIDWLFPTVDPNEWFYAQNSNGQIVQQLYEYNYIDPDSPNPSGGIHPAYSDFRLRSVDVGRLTPHGSRVSSYIIGDKLGQAQSCRYTVVKLPQYTNGPRSQGSLFPLYSVKDALTLIVEDIMERKGQGEELFVISSALGHVFSRDADDNPKSARRGFEAMWQNALNWFNDNGVTICASAGNSGGTRITLSPARIFQEPEIVIGSVTPRALAHPESQGRIGDGILTAYAPGPGNLMLSSDANGAYDYQYIDPSGSAVTSYACGVAVGYIAQTIALGYSGNAVVPPNSGEKPNAYAYRMVSSNSRPRVAGGPPIIYNNAPLELYQDCGGPGGYRKRDGSCPLSRIDLPTGTDALPVSISAAIMAGNGGQFGGAASGTTPTNSAASGANISGIQASAGNASSKLTTSPSTTAAATALCSHAADPENSCAAIANGPGWCACGGSSSTYAVQTSASLPCGWTTLPPTTQFDCPTATNRLVSTAPPTTTNPTSSTPPSPSPNAAIAIWLQQYSSTSGAEVGTWFAYTYTPGDTNLGSACKSSPKGTVSVPNGTPVDNELNIYPASMAISAYGRKLQYEAFHIGLSEAATSWAMDLWDTQSGAGLGSCSAVSNVAGVNCDSQRVLTPVAKCEWAN